MSAALQARHAFHAVGGIADSMDAGHEVSVQRHSGQSTVELALVLPFFALMLLAVVQIGLLTRTRLLVTHIAREAVREAAVGGDAHEVRVAATVASDLDPSRLEVRVIHVGRRVTVELSYTDPTDVPVVGSLVGDAVFYASATMRLE